MTVRRPDDGEDRDGVWVDALDGDLHTMGEWPLAAMELNNGQLVIHKPDDGEQWLQSDLWISSEEAQ